MMQVWIIAILSASPWRPAIGLASLSLFFVASGMVSGILENPVSGKIAQVKSSEHLLLGNISLLCSVSEHHDVWTWLIPFNTDFHSFAGIREVSKSSGTDS